MGVDRLVGMGLRLSRRAALWLGQLVGTPVARRNGRGMVLVDDLPRDLSWRSPAASVPRLGGMIPTGWYLLAEAE